MVYQSKLYRFLTTEFGIRILNSNFLEFIKIIDQIIQRIQCSCTDFFQRKLMLNFQQTPEKYYQLPVSSLPFSIFRVRHHQHHQHTESRVKNLDLPWVKKILTFLGRFRHTEKLSNNAISFRGSLTWCPFSLLLLVSAY